MADFSASEAAFTGFRIVRERPAAAAVWVAVQFLISLGFGAFITFTSGRAMTRLIQLQATGAVSRTDPAQLLALMGQLAPLYGLLLAFSLVFYPVLFAAMNRAVLQPEEQRFGYLRLGADELRQLLMLSGFFLIFIAVYVAAVVIAVLASVLIGAAAGLISKELAGPAVALVAAILIVGSICAAVFVAVRLSLASALTFATKRVNLFGSWAMTEGRFWPILGTYLLAFALAALVWSLVFALTAASAMVVGGTGVFQVLMTADLNSPAAYFSPARIVYLALSAVSSALIWPLALTPPASIYRNLGGARGYPPGGDGSVRDTFA